VDISAVSVSGSGYSVSGVGGGTNLTPGQSAVLTVSFDPSTAGSLPGTVKITSDAAGSPLSISLSGTGVAAPTYVLTPSPASLSFGSVSDGTTASKQVNLQNTGTGNVDISTVTITGSGYTFSGVANGTNLTPGQTAVLTVNFDPSTTGSLPGTVTVKSNAAGSPLSIGLSGTGTSGSSPHSVALAWDPSSSSVVGYYVYRSSKPSGPFKKLNTTPNSNTGYTDSNVTDGLMYFYYVTAVNSEGIESSDSNQISVTIPSD
jgi:sorbitol-specific phosphotransferase system component IIA